MSATYHQQLFVPINEIFIRFFGHLKAKLSGWQRRVAIELQPMFRLSRLTLAPNCSFFFCFWIFKFESHWWITTQSITLRQKSNSSGRRRRRRRRKTVTQLLQMFPLFKTTFKFFFFFSFSPLFLFFFDFSADWPLVNLARHWNANAIRNKRQERGNEEIPPPPPLAPLRAMIGDYAAGPAGPV